MKNYIPIFVISVIAFFVLLQTYKMAVLNTMLTTGHVFCNVILNAEINYYSKHGKFKYTDKTSMDEDLMIDARSDLFFSAFSVEELDNGKSLITAYGYDNLKNYILTLEFDKNSKSESNPNKLKIKRVKLKNYHRRTI